MTKAAIDPAVDPLRMTDTFMDRHLGPDEEQREAMLRSLGVGSLEELIDSTIPASIRLAKALDIDEGLTESEALAELRRIADENAVFRSFIGMGYHATLTPGVIQLRQIYLLFTWKLRSERILGILPRASPSRRRILSRVNTLWRSSKRNRCCLLRLKHLRHC